MKGTILSLTAAFAFLSAEAQELTVENFTREMDAVWADYEREAARYPALVNEYPDKSDSIEVALSMLGEKALQETLNVAIRYASLPEGLEQLYRSRLRIPKDTLRAVFDRIPDALRTSPYGQSLARHIAEEQIQEGDAYSDFTALNAAGEPFEISSLAGKNILFLYGGIDCMGPHGQEFLYDLYQKTDRAEFEIVMYEPALSPEQLQQTVARFPRVEFIWISDFLGDHSPIKLRYGAQATPTCFLIDKTGAVTLISLGLPMRRLNEMYN